MLDENFILTTSAIRLNTVVPASLLGLTLAKLMLNSLTLVSWMPQSSGKPLAAEEFFPT